MLEEKFWNKYFSAYDALNVAIPYQELMGDIIKASRAQKGDKILDAGSGTGNLSVLLEKKGAKVTGLDYSKAGIDIHRSKSPEAEIIKADLNHDLPFADNSFDVLVTNNVVYAIKKELRRPLFKEFYRVLRPGGRIAVANIHKGFKPMVIFTDHLKKSVKKKGSFKTIVDFFKYCFLTGKIFYYNHLIKKENAGGQYDFLEKSEQRELLKNAGFRVDSDTKNTYSNQSYLDTGIKI